MILTDKNIQSFQNLYFKKFGFKIKKEDAYERGIKLVRLVEIILKHKNKIQNKKYYV